MDSLESEIVEILKRGTPLRAVKIADILGVEKREVMRNVINIPLCAGNFNQLKLKSGFHQVD